ncbi:response regulator [Ulvibacter antarcticus]|uniref:LuxR family two component transcriptional regulator n=1 Tax=Ulvibacter antarcticus TaxID=442714 RepID=A0A3L9YYQ2_9FLAO|nr:response regulator transcription factor [Ulvibacter antarcticus]RMA65786.1 LuxR family two component transcriptional regulator [Ulvibacter antarcticus]
MIDKKNLSIVIADDHPILLKGLYDEFTYHGYNICGSAENGMQALELILTERPTIAFLDIDMPLLTGFDVIKTAKEKGANTKFIVLSFHKETEYITQAKALQINGYLLKEDSFHEIEKCMIAVLNNETFFSSSFASNMLKNASEELRKLKLLTPSEVTILKLAAKQETNQEIAESLFVSIRTIEKHRSNIISKLEIEGGANILSSWALNNKSVIMGL